MLAVNNLRRPGLAPASLAIADGECLALTGPSGAGKTLLLRAIVDLDPNEGDVTAAGAVRAKVAAPAWRRMVAYVPAEPGWWAETVADHFAAPEAARALLVAMGLPEAALGWPVARLSTGERQRLALARALVDDPPTLLLDEPTAALDAEATQAVEDVLRHRLDAGASILLVTHDAAQERRLADRSVHMIAGRLEPATVDAS